ncbi:hypothetical protein NP572_01445 [Pseudomonas putida]|uniref:hypothetical protein n=1 Tax=Pseudomonas putida TaxID=303 RepID=UPI0023648FBB|nr:hypothetical protein [Pseudomonas putida]MDD2035362.1 hypothetical protein [Pseudomonas putida]MDD2040812.1 hypothetical protein [Pseudomonas putida]
MAAAENSINQLEYPCTHCGTMFKRRPGGRHTCTRTCAKAAERKQKAPKLTAKQRKVERRKQRLLECAFGYWLLEQAVRAGTVQTYHGITAAGLHRLYEQHNYRKMRLGWLDGGHGKDVYHLCHVQPLKGRDGSTGLTIAENLFTGIAELNQKQSNKPVKTWAGASLPTTARKRKWNITREMTRDQVLQKLADFIGPELDAFLDELDKIPQRTFRLRLAKTVFNQQSNELCEPLERSYTLAELESLKAEELQVLNAIQQGSTGISSYAHAGGKADSKLGVLHDELVRFSAVLADGQHRDNCQFMLKLVRVMGIYLAQIGRAEGKAHSRFLAQGNASWAPLSHLYQGQPWRTPAHLLADDLDGLLNGEYDAKGRELKLGIVPMAQAALQGLDIDRDYISNRLLKRLVVNTLDPAVAAPEQWSWEENGSDWLTYIDNLYASLEPTWQALLDVGLCTEDQVFDAHDAVLVNLVEAVEQSRKHYREQRLFTVYQVPFTRYPEHLEFPPVAAGPLLEVA